MWYNKPITWIGAPTISKNAAIQRAWQYLWYRCYPIRLRLARAFPLYCYWMVGWIMTFEARILNPDYIHILKVSPAGAK